MRAQVVVLGPIERELYVRLTDDILPEGTKRAEELSWRIVGCGIEVAERLNRLGLSVAVVTGSGSSPEDRELVKTLRGRGIHMRGTRSGAYPTPMSVRVQTPRHRVKIAPPAPDRMPPSDVVVSSVDGSRHFHACGPALVERRGAETARSALARARAAGTSTSLDLGDARPRETDWRALRALMEHTDVLFADSDVLRALAGEERVGGAAAAILERGVGAIAVRLASGGWRVYAVGCATRIPSLGAEVPAAASAFASGFLLGWLLGAGPAVCGVLGAAATLEATRKKFPTRRELASRLNVAGQNPTLRKLVPTLSEGKRLVDKTHRLPRRNLAGTLEFSRE